MKPKQNKTAAKAVSWLVGVVLIVFVALCFWLYSGQLTSAKIKIFSILPLPMAFVGGQSVPMSQFILRYNIAAKMQGNAPDFPGWEQTKSQIYNELISEAEDSRLAAANGVSVSQKEIDAEYQSQSAAADLQGQKDFAALLNGYGANENIFKSQVIKPELVKTKLEIWYNSQPGLNQNLYSQANNLLQRIRQGEDMGVLAQSFSQDQTGQAVKGDLGFADAAQILPEMREAVAAMQPGDLKIIPSRYGLHIIKLEEKNGNLAHLRQIFLQGRGFDAWYGGQTQNIKIKKLINF